MDSGMLSFTCELYFIQRLPKPSKASGLWRSSANCSFTRADSIAVSVVGQWWARAGMGSAFLTAGNETPIQSWEFKVPPPKLLYPPQEIRPKKRDYEPLVSLNKALLGAYFLRGWHWWGHLEFP